MLSREFQTKSKKFSPKSKETKYYVNFMENMRPTLGFT